MLTLEQAAAFLPAAFLLTLAPGPDILMTVSLGLARGRQAAVGFGLGCVTGCVTHTLLTAFGVGALMLASPRAFFVLKCAGAVYLLWLAWKLLAPGRQAAADKPPPEDRFYARGILSSSLNPKVIIFYCAFFPQFVRPGHPAPPQLLLLGLLFMLQAALVLSLAGWFAGSLGRRLARDARVNRLLNRAAALVFAVVALLLVARPS